MYFGFCAWRPCFIGLSRYYRSQPCRMNSDAAGNPAAPTLPPKHRFQATHKRKASEEEAPSHPQLCPSLDETPFGERPLTRDAKQVKVTTSKIQGTAQPRKPRIGADFQALVPEWTGPPQELLPSKTRPAGAPEKLAPPPQGS